MEKRDTKHSFSNSQRLSPSHAGYVSTVHLLCSIFHQAGGSGATHWVPTNTCREPMLRKARNVVDACGPYSPLGGRALGSLMGEKVDLLHV